MLPRARRGGDRAIEIQDLAAPEALTQAVKDKLRLKRAAVVETSSVGALTARQPRVGAFSMEAGLAAGSVVAIGWGRAVRAVVEAGRSADPRRSGSPPQAACSSMLRISRSTNSSGWRLSNRGVAISSTRLTFPRRRRETPSSPIRSSPEASRCGAGSMQPSSAFDLPHASNSPEASAADPSEQALVNAAGDVIRHYVDANGKPIDWDGETIIAVSFEQLSRIPRSIGVALGENKADAIIGAARAGLISALVTDMRTARL